MSERMFETRMDDVFDGIINITRNGENLAWFFNDSTTDEQVEKICDLLNEQQDTIERLKRRLDYETRMHKRWKDDCLAILEEQDLNDYVKELQKSKKSGWDSEPNTDYVTRVKEGLK